MIELFGPTYRFAGEVVTEPDIIVVNDHHYDETNHCYHVEKLLENSSSVAQDCIIVMDHINHDDELTKYNCLCLPILIAAQGEEFKNQQIDINWHHKTHAFNFMINKPRPHREFLLMLIEHFKLDNYTHTLPWRTINPSRNSLKQSTTNSLYHSIIDSTRINIATTNYRFGPEVTMDQGIRNGNFKNSEIYKHLLQTTVFEPSCISLITEPVFYERETIHTEKTIMAVYGGTLPIWVGGWRLPDYMKSLGFDVFDDIIDHSYQSLPDPLDRAYLAVERNLDLLKDFNRAKKFIEKNRARLEHNLNLFKENVFLTDCFDKVNQYPKETQSKLLSIVPKYRNNTAVGYRNRPDYRLLGTYSSGAEHDRTFLNQDNA